MKLDKIKIGVLGGGVSSEREISLISAKQVYEVLASKGLDVVFIDIFTSLREEVKETIEAHSLDLAFVALHGEFGEDGKVQSILEELGIAYTGSRPRASYLAMDKVLSKTIFRKNRINTPGFFVCFDSDNILYNSGYPVVVKPNFSGSSLGVSIVEKEGSLKRSVSEAFAYSNKVILEDYIEGKELTVGILDDEPLAVVEIIPKKGYFDFNAKYDKGKASFIAPAKLEPYIYKEVQRQAQAAYRALGCRHFCRVDIRLSKDNVPYVLEVNSIPGLTQGSLLPLSARACDIDFDELVLRMAEVALYGQKETQKV